MNNTLKRAIELCLAVYRITDKFPRGEVLSPKLRGLAVDIVECLVYSKALPTNSGRVFNLEGFEQKIRVLLAYFAISEKQDWVNKRNFMVLSGEYRKLLIPLGIVPDGIPGNSMEKAENVSLSERQTRIIGYLEKNSEGRTILDIAKLIASSNKTVERELKRMIANGLVRKQGNTKGARFIIDK